MTEATSSQDSVSTIRRSTALFFSGTMLSRVSGMFRDIALAYSFGTHEALAAFFVGYRFSQLFRRLLGEGALQSAFIPIFEEIKAKSAVNGCRFFRDLSLLWTGLVSVICMLCMGGLWFSLSFCSQGAKEIVALSIIMIPSLLPTCLFGLNSSFLQSQKQYFVSAVAPVFFNIVLIFSALILRSASAVEAMPLLSLGIVLACAMQYAATCVPVFKQCSRVLGRGLLRGFSLFSKDIWRLWKPLSFGLIGIGASQINSAVDTLFARAAESQGPALLWFAIRFQLLPLSLFGIALSSALLPPLTRAVQAQETKKFLSFVEFAIRQVIALLLPCMALFFVLGFAMINCVYGHGSFRADSVLATTACLHGYALALVPMGLITILAPAFYAQKKYTIPIQGALLSLVLNIVLNAIMVFGLGWGAVSVTIATSISAWINALYLYRNLSSSFGPLITRSGYWQIFRISLALLITTFCVWQILSFLSLSPPLFNWWAPSHIPIFFLNQLAHLLYPMVVFAICLFLSARIVRADDLFSLLRSFRR